MKLLFKIAGSILFILFFGLALKNMHTVTLHFFLGYETSGPLILLLFGFFLVGFIFGVLGMTPIAFRHYRNVSKHKKIIDNLQKENEAQQLARTQAPQPDGIMSK